MIPLLAALAAVSAPLPKPQDTPVLLPKTALPKRVTCVVCTSAGESHGEERPAAGVSYLGQKYYFCASAEVDAFVKNPEAYLPPVLPRPAPAMRATDLAGNQVQLADYKGKVVLLDFWATWCKPCVASMPALDKLATRWKDQGVVVVGLSVDQDPTKVGPFLKRKPVSYSILLDDRVSPTFGSFKVAVLPSLYLIDRAGNIVAQWRGSAKPADIEKAIERAVR